MSSTNATNIQDFAFASGGVRLCGTLERPSQGETVGSVLLLSGSGPQDRDESIAGKKPFAVLSRALVNWGFQVFRWDDRGVGESGGDYLAASELHLAGDVISAMLALGQETGFDKHLLVGHSQGALIAAAAAAKHPVAVAGIILLAGIGLPGRQSLIDQHLNMCKAEGWADSDIQQSLPQKEALFDILLEAQSRIDAGESATSVLQDLETNLLEAFLGDLALSELSDEERLEVESTIEDLLEWEWRYLLQVDPATDLQKVLCPVLAVCGDKDAQVQAQRNLARIKDACASGGAASITVSVVADNNHLFQKTSTAALSEYEVLGEPFCEDVLSTIRSWLNVEILSS